MKKDLEKDLVLSFFKLLRQLKRHQSNFSHLDITPLQIHTMIFIKEQGNPTMSDLSVNLRTSLPTATKLIDRLIKLKLIQRKIDKDDRRIIRLSLTDQGVKILSLKLKRRVRRMKQVLALLPKEDIVHLHRIINSLLLHVGGKNV